MYPRPLQPGPRIRGIMGAMKLKELPGLIIGHGIILLMILFLCGAGLAILVAAAQSVYPGPFDFGNFISERRTP